MLNSVGKWLDRPATAWAAGVAWPLLMVLLDPTVFRSSFFGVGSPILGHLKGFGYVGIALGVTTLALCLVSERPRAVLAGCLMGGCLFSVGLGVVLLPFSVLGTLFFGVGLLGLSPFLSAMVFGRWSRRVFAGAPPSRRMSKGFAGFLLFFAIPFGVQRASSAVLDRAVADILSGRPDRVERGVARLERWGFLVDVDSMVGLWTEQREESRRRILASAYQRVTGRDIASRAAELAD
jgi:hypothetical protein